MKVSVPSFQLYYDREFIAEIPMNSSDFMIGRKSGCYLRLLDSSVSREHCRISLRPDGSLLVEDLSSTNGTLINETRIVKQKLSPNDVVTIGRCSLVFHELEPHVIEESMGGFWNRLRGRSATNFTSPRGKYILPRDNLMTQFDSVSYSMVRDQTQADGKKQKNQEYLKRIPRLKIVGDASAKKDEITRFEVSKNIFIGEEDHTLQMKEQSMPVFAQPEVRGPFLKIPWKMIERVFIPLIIIVVAVFVGRYILSFQIDTQMTRFEESWNKELEDVAEKLRFADDRTFQTSAPLALNSIKQTRAQPLSVDEVWKRIEMRPDLRSMLIFQVLDHVLESEDITWSLDKALANLSKLKSVTSRMPSMKKMRLVLKAESTPFPMEGLRQGTVLFLTEQTRAKSSTEAYQEYRADLSPRLAGVSECASVRKSISGGKVVLAFSISPKGNPTSVFVNESRSTKEPKLWKCVRERISKIELPPPPGGRMSVIYTFNFAGPTKITF